MPPSTGQRLLRFDRGLGARFVAGADEAGRGSLAGPLVVAGVLLDYERLRDHRVRPLATLNDSKQVAPEEREELFRAVVGCASAVAVRVFPPGEIDREGLHRCNLRGLREVLAGLAPPGGVCLVDGFRLGPLAPPHRAVVDGDWKSAAIAAASIVAKVVRDRAMRRLDALYPPTASPRTSATSLPATRRSCASGARQTSTGSRSTRSATPVNPGERRAARHYRLRGYRVLGANVRAGGYELDLVLRRGRRLVFCEVKERSRTDYGNPVEMVGPEKLRRVRQAAEAWLAAHPELRDLRRGARGRRGPRRPRRARARLLTTPQPRASDPSRYPSQSRGALSPNGRTRQNGRRARVRRPERAGETSG